MGQLRYVHPPAAFLARSAAVIAALVSVGCSTIGAPQTAQAPTGSVVLATAGTSSNEPVAPSNAAHTTQVYVYPGQGQTAQQLDRDRYECYRWAVGQTGFDPSQPSLAPHQRVEVIAAPAPGADTVAGAVTGAILGAAVSHPGHAAGGAIVGALLGGLIGGASDATRVQGAREAQERYDQRDAERLARFEQQSNDYRRALTVCLEGRGYTVK
jgi:hypothetical protein